MLSTRAADFLFASRALDAADNNAGGRCSGQTSQHRPRARKYGDTYVSIGVFTESSWEFVELIGTEILIAGTNPVMSPGTRTQPHRAQLRTGFT
jgi:hypothetical protein